MLLVGVVDLLTAAAFIAVGLRFNGRPVAAENVLARTAFVTWWWSFAAYLAWRGLLDLGAAFGNADLQAQINFRLVSGPLLSVAAWGLAFHILYLWSGRRGWALGLGVYYAVAAIVFATAIHAGDPQAVIVTDWSTDLDYATPPDGPVWNAILASIGIPLVAGSLAYLGLLRRAADRAQRYRITLVGASLAIWVASGYAAEVAGSPAARFVAIVVLGLLTAGAVVAAYYPPPRVVAWLARGAAIPAR